MKVFNFITSLKNAIHKTELGFLDIVPSNVHSIQMEERVMRIARQPRNPQRTASGASTRSMTTLSSTVLLSSEDSH